jgi:toxin ParE1/3/4
VKRVRFTLKAREDLLGIWVQIALNDEPTANAIYDRIEERCRQLADFPEMAPVRPEIAAQARALVIERWLALYRIVPDGVQIVRIVDGARDLTKLSWIEDTES